MTRSFAVPIVLTTEDDVELSANLLMPVGDEVGAVVVCHPHPLYGGDQDHPIVVALCEALAAAGWLALSFDFRGTNSSGGSHDGGRAEQLDVSAAVDYLSQRLAPEKPVLAAGYSFGAATVFATHHPRISARIGIALPVAMLTALQPAPEPGPRLLIHPRHDQYTSVADLERTARSWPAPAAAIHVLEGADHFLNGFVHRVAEQVVAWTRVQIEM